MSLNPSDYDEEELRDMGRTYGMVEVDLEYTPEKNTHICPEPECDQKEHIEGGIGREPYWCDQCEFVREFVPISRDGS